MLLRGNELFYILTSLGKSAHIVKVELSFSENIDITTLKQALRTVSKSYPLFASQLVMTSEGKLSLEPTDAPLPVYEDLRPRGLGTDENNGYMYRVSIEKDILSIIMLHALTDARGAAMFAKALAYEYCRDKYGLEQIPEFENSVLVFNDNEVNKVPYEVLMEQKIEQMPLENEPAASKGPAFVLTSEDAISDGIYSVKYNNEQLVKKSKELGFSVFSFIQSMVVRAIEDNYDAKDEPIVSNVTVDLRSRLQVLSQSNFSASPIKFSFGTKEKELDIVNCAKLKKEELDSMDIVKLGKQEVLLSHQMDAMFEHIDFQNELMVQKMMLLFNQASEVSCSFIYSNFGVFDLPDAIKQYVNDVKWISLKDGGKGAAILAYCYQNSGVIQLLNCLANEKIAKTVSCYLDQFEIQNEVIKEDIGEVDTFALDKVLRAE